MRVFVLKRSVPAWNSTEKVFNSSRTQFVMDLGLSTSVFSAREVFQRSYLLIIYISKRLLSLNTVSRKATLELGTF